MQLLRRAKYLIFRVDEFQPLSGFGIVGLALRGSGDLIAPNFHRAASSRPELLTRGSKPAAIRKSSCLPDE